jgi:UDP-glucose 4-epimerase
MRRVLVTGGAGFIGSHLVDRLARDAANELIVLDNLRRGSLANLNGSRGLVRFVNGDVRDRSCLADIMSKVDVVYHLAAQSNVMGAVSDIDYCFSTNVIGTFEVFRAAAESGVRRVIFTSSREVYGDPQELPVPETAPLRPKNAYGASKAAGEMYSRIFRDKGLEVIVLRLANVYGARDFDRVIPIFLGQAVRNLPLNLYGGTQLLDFVWIDTVVDILVQAALVAAPPGPTNVGTGKPTALLSLAECILSLTGSESPLCILPSRDVEVSRFAADTANMTTRFDVIPPTEPLGHLVDIVRLAKDIPETQTEIQAEFESYRKGLSLS